MKIFKVGDKVMVDIPECKNQIGTVTKCYESGVVLVEFAKGLAVNTAVRSEYVHPAYSLVRT